jgi:hypothetical protein
VATVVTPPAVRVSIEQEQQGINIANVYWLKVSPSPAVPAALGLLAQNMSNFWANNFLPTQHPTVSLTGCEVLYYGPSGEYSGSFARSSPGTATGSALPNDNALVISWEIARTYRGGHPRSYIAGQVSPALETTIEWTPAHITAMLAAAEAFMASVNAMTTADFSSVQLGTMSRSSGGVPRPTTLFEPYTAATIQPRVCSQRRRLGRLL